MADGDNGRETALGVLLDGVTRAPAPTAPWRRRVVERSLNDAAQRSVDKSAELIFAAAMLLERSNGDDFTVQEVADMAKQSVRTVYVHFDGKDDLLLAVFEEAMHAYARLLGEALEQYDDPLERVAAAVYFAARLSERATGGVAAGIAKLRARFAATMPEALATAQWPLTELYATVLRRAAEAGVIELPKLDVATYVVRALVDSVGVNRVLGNQFGLTLPEPVDLVEFVLHGFKAELSPGWQQRFDAHWESLPPLFSVAQDLQIADTRRNGRRRR